MNRDCGTIESKVWLVGDSEPGNYSKRLQDPFDLKHPTVHNIVTPIIEQIQDDLFYTGNRIDWSKLYIRNAVKSSIDWKDEATLGEEILNFKSLLNEHSPMIIIPFGARAFEFVRRALGEEYKGLNSWGTYKLGEQFAKRCQEFNVNKTNIIPLLHACICRGRFLEAHRNFCTAISNINGMAEENYFIAAGKTLSPILIENKSSFNCWKIPS
jgi:hypothetical protein